MELQSNETYFEKLNQLGKEGNPFLFLIDFEMKNPVVFPLNDIPNDIYFEVSAYKKLRDDVKPLPENIVFDKELPDFNKYTVAFDQVMSHLKHGDTYLLNLTMPVNVQTNLDLEQIFDHSHSKFRLLYRNKFVCFSPEIFVRIDNGKISSYPMKGTIDASIENAAQLLIDSPKEFAEHNTIVDLIRNDLSTVAKEVRVEQFRYIDRVKTNQGELLQVSSEIVGKLDDDYSSRIGTILSCLLPAGSICGAPKQMTVDSILNIEKYDRTYYTGIFGVFDGVNLESGVLIRYIENEDGQLVFKSGGGITALSNLKEEYQELCNKVYVPII
jgi:para-aminobenzoate synthetase component 1